MDPQVLRTLLQQDLEPGPLRESLEAMSLPPTHENGICLQMLRKAAAGDLSAAKYILDAAAPDAPATDLRSLPTSVLLKMLEGEDGGNAPACSA